MSTKVIEAEYDGKVLIPKEPLDLPAGTRLYVSIRLEQEVDGRLRKLRELWEYAKERAVDVPTLHHETLRRENLYEDRL